MRTRVWRRDLLLPGDRGGRGGEPERRLEPGERDGDRVDTTPPSAPSGLSAPVSGSTVSLGWTASTDNVGVTRYNVHRSTTSGFTPGVANRSRSRRGRAMRLGSGGGHLLLRVIAEDAAGNLSAASSQASATVTTAPPSGGLVAAYAFDEGAGSTTADRSGNGNNGTLSNATWAGASAGRFGNALSFNGTSAFVTVPDSNSLDLTTGMTLEAWVSRTPAATVSDSHHQGAARRPTCTACTRLGHEPAQPRSHDLRRGADPGRRNRLAAQHLDARRRDLQRDDACGCTSTACRSDTAVTGRDRRRPAAPDRRQRDLGRVLQGQIDEVRVYNRALSAAEIQDDMNTSIVPDTTPPTIVTKAPAHREAGVNVGTSVIRRHSARWCARAPSRVEHRAARPGGAHHPATVKLQRGDERRDADAAGGAPVREDLHGDREGRSGARPTSRQPLAADVTWTFTTEAAPQVARGELSGEPFGTYSTRSSATRGSTLHDGRRLAASRRC